MIRAHQIIEQHVTRGIFRCDGSTITVDFIDRLCAFIEGAQKFDCSAVSDEDLDDKTFYAAGKQILQETPAAIPAELTYFEFGRAIAAVCVQEPDHVAMFAFCKPHGDDWTVSHCYTRFERDRAPQLSMGIADLPDMQQASSKLTSLAASHVSSVIGMIDARRTTHIHEPAPEVLNGRRIARGRPPLFAHTIVTVPGRASHASDARGSHASPRLHFRRGHLRRLPTGKRVAVKGALVGDPARGYVSHDYAVTPSPQPRQEP